MHCGYLFYLTVALWAELAAGRAVPTDSAVADWLNTIKDLQKALCEYDSALQKAVRQSTKLQSKNLNFYRQFWRLSGSMLEVTRCLVLYLCHRQLSGRGLISL